MLVSILSVSAFASDDEEFPADDPIDTESYTKTISSTGWTRIYTGNGSAVTLYISNFSAFYCDIQMLGYDGSELWYQWHTMAPNGTGEYYVGSDVQYVNLRNSAPAGAGYVEIYVS